MNIDIIYVAGKAERDQFHSMAHARNGLNDPAVTTGSNVSQYAAMLKLRRSLGGLPAE